MGLVVFYAMINWMPVLFKDAACRTTSASVVTALFPLGGVFAVFAGWLMDRLNANVTVAICFALTSVAVWAIGQSDGIYRGADRPCVVAGDASQHGTNVAALFGCSLLSYPGPRDWHRLDDGPRSLWRHRRVVSCWRAQRQKTRIRRDLHGVGSSCNHRRICAFGEAIRNDARGHFNRNIQRGDPHTLSLSGAG